jgi:hypothetical protein
MEARRLGEVKLGLKRWRTEQAAAKAPKNPNGSFYLALTGSAWNDASAAD